MDAIASTVAEPVNLVSHHTSANWAARLPISENACPVQIVKNGAFHPVRVFIEIPVKTCQVFETWQV